MVAHAVEYSCRIPKQEPITTLKQRLCFKRLGTARHRKGGHLLNCRALDRWQRQQSRYGASRPQCAVGLPHEGGRLVALDAVDLHAVGGRHARR